MTFSNPGLKYTAKFIEEASGAAGSDMRSCQIEEKDGKQMRTFTGKVTRSQSTRPDAERDIERWCEMNPSELPKGGGTIAKTIDLNEVRIR